MGRQEFAWRMPRETAQKDEQRAKGPLEASIDGLLDLLAKGIGTLKNWISKFFEWLEGLLPGQDRKPTTSRGNWMSSVRFALVIFLIVLLAFLILILAKIWRRRHAGPTEKSNAVAACMPDLADESIKADDLPTNRWLSLAKEMTLKGDLRLAMRALYLASLAHLAEKELITIEIYKSNREYEQELIRRAHEKKELLSIFSNSLCVFERIWFGMYQLTRADFDHYAANQRRIQAFADE
jgi:hypothetical protein